MTTARKLCSTVFWPVISTVRHAIVEQNTLDLFARGKLHPLLSWIHLLPAELAERRPWLNIYQAWALAFAARLPEAEPNYQKSKTFPVLHEADVEENARIQNGNQSHSQFRSGHRRQPSICHRADKPSR